MEFKANDRGYSTYTWEGDSDDPSIDPVADKLLSGDIVNTDGIERCSPYRTRSILGVLVLDGSSFGRKKNKLFYKCIPNDKSLPVFLVPFEDKITSFSKRKLNRFVSFKFLNWDGKHPEGQLIETIGYVSEIDAYCEYMLRCKDVSHHIQKFTKDVFKAIITRGHELNDVLKGKKYIDRREQYVMSIDPEGCEDIDDAFSCKQSHDGTVTLSVYIANVPAWLDHLGLWDHINARVSTIYLPDRERPMLPAALSCGLCSLKSGSDKLTMCMDVVVESGKVKSTAFNVAVVNLAKNFAYEDSELDSAPGYTLAMSTVDALNHRDKMLDDIIDSHDLVQYMMLLMNVEAASKLSGSNDGIFRSLKIKNTGLVPSDIPRDISTIAMAWGSSGGCYTKEAHVHDLIGYKLYAHITSPIRRLIDIYNMSAMLETCGFTIDTSRISTIKDSLDWINKDMKSIRRVQSDVDTLINVESGKLEGPQEGYVIDMDVHGWSVYFPSVKKVCMCKTDMEGVQYKKYEFTFHSFIDEHNLRKKIRIALIE
jgi:exoribonuclease R